MINYFNYITLSYKQLIEGQRYQIQELLQENTPKERIAELVGTLILTLYIEKLIEIKVSVNIMPN